MLTYDEEGNTLLDGDRLILEWLGGKPTKWRVFEQFGDVPPGFVTDLSSVPKLFRFYLSKGEAAPAAVRHDYKYYTGEGTRKENDQTFREECHTLCELRTSQSFVLWFIVRITGWRAYNQHRKREARARSVESEQGNGQVEEQED